MGKACELMEWIAIAAVLGFACVSTGAAWYRIGFLSGLI